jgi:hypothetical protein
MSADIEHVVTTKPDADIGWPTPIGPQPTWYNECSCGWTSISTTYPGAELLVEDHLSLAEARGRP